MAKSRSDCWGIAKWSTWSIDHITRSDRYDWYAYKCIPRGDDTYKCIPRRDNAYRCILKGDNTYRYIPRGDDIDKWRPVVWLVSLESQFVIKGAVVHLNWDLSFMVAK